MVGCTLRATCILEDESHWTVAIVLEFWCGVENGSVGSTTAVVLILLHCAMAFQSNFEGSFISGQQLQVQTDPRLQLSKFRPTSPLLSPSGLHLDLSESEREQTAYGYTTSNYGSQQNDLHVGTYQNNGYPETESPIDSMAPSPTVTLTSHPRQMLLSKNIANPYYRAVCTFHNAVNILSNNLILESSIFGRLLNGIFS